jgi:hypothetical protein
VKHDGRTASEALEALRRKRERKRLARLPALPQLPPRLCVLSDETKLVLDGFRLLVLEKLACGMLDETCYSWSFAMQRTGLSRNETARSLHELCNMELLAKTGEAETARGKANVYRLDRELLDDLRAVLPGPNVVDVLSEVVPKALPEEQKHRAHSRGTTWPDKGPRRNAPLLHLAAEEKRRCSECGASLDGRRADAQTCSSRCRMQRSRRTQFQQPTREETPGTFDACQAS